jgi:hypothetical protein
MKFYLAILACLTVFFLSPGCKKDDTRKSDPYKCTSCVATPEAKSANDASSKGVYKGIVIGSTGTIKFDVLNSGSTIKAYLTLDGTAIELTSSVEWNGASGYIAPFKGTLNGQQVTISFSVSANGSAPSVVSSNIPGHSNAEFVLVKEYSAALIECFEGSYHTTRPEDGTFNIIISRALGLWGGIARENGQSGTDDIEGTIVNNQLLQDGKTLVGTISNDEISGSFKDSDGKTVTVKGKRTL